MKRKYFGTVHLKKVWIGKKSVNLRIEPEEAEILSKIILNAAGEGKDFDLNSFYTKKRKSDNKISMTVTRGLEQNENS